MGVLADSVDPGIFDPPDAVLDEIVGNERIPVVQVRHPPVEPPVGEEFPLGRSSMRIDRSPFVVAGSHEGVVEVQPVPARKVVHPPMGAAAVIEYHVHHDLHSVVMGLPDESDIFFHGSETGVHRIIVGNCVAVIGPCGILLDRIEPDGRDSEVLDVVEMVGYALDVAAVAAAVASPVRVGPPDGIVGRVAVGKPVWSDEIKDVFRSEAHGSGLGVPLLQLILPYGLLPVLFEHYVEGSRLGLGRYLEIDEKVVGVLGPDDFSECYSFLFQGHLRAAYILAVDQELQRMVFHADPPERRFYPVYLRSICRYKEAKACEDGKQLFHNRLIGFILDQLSDPFDIVETSVVLDRHLRIVGAFEFYLVIVGDRDVGGDSGIDILTGKGIEPGPER